MKKFITLFTIAFLLTACGEPFPNFAGNWIYTDVDGTWRCSDGSQGDAEGVGATISILKAGENWFLHLDECSVMLREDTMEKALFVPEGQTCTSVYNEITIKSRPEKWTFTSVTDNTIQEYADLVFTFSTVSTDPFLTCDMNYGAVLGRSVKIE